MMPALPFALTLLLAAPPTIKPAAPTARQYADYYGSAFTTNPKHLTWQGQAFRWGVTNPKPVDMAYFGGTLRGVPKTATRFKATLCIDEDLKAPLVFTFKAGDRNGETLDTLTLKPGTRQEVDIALSGAKALFFQTEVKINHGKATRILLGEPRFE